MMSAVDHIARAVQHVCRCVQRRDKAVARMREPTRLVLLRHGI